MARTTGPRAAIDLRHLFGRQVSLIRSYMGGKPEMLAAAEHFFAGRFKPVLDQAFPVSRAADAHRRLECREQFGKIALTPDGSVWL